MTSNKMELILIIEFVGLDFRVPLGASLGRLPQELEHISTWT